jgi:hypothetical protein
VPVLLVFVAGLVAIQLHDDVARRNQTRGIRLDAVTAAAARASTDAVLFGSSGGQGPIFAAFDYGHPANILDHYIALRVGVPLVDDDACSRVAPFLLGSQTPRHGLWLFYAYTPVTAFGGFAGVTVTRPTPNYFVVRSTAALPPRQLVDLGRRLRLAWRASHPQDARVNELLIADRNALRDPRHCPAYPKPDELGDPDISPHWPPVNGPQ